MSSDANLLRLLRAHFRRQQAEAVAALKADRPIPTFQADVPRMVETLTPVLLPQFLRGGRRAAREIGGQVRQRKALSVAAAGGMIAKKAAPESFAARLFRLFFPRAEEAVGKLVLTFAEETNRTTHLQLVEARAKLRQELLEGLHEGEALTKLTARVRTIFDTPRAYDIARTESNRAVSAGGLLAAQESGVVRGKTWVASREACSRCRALGGKTVPLDRPFVVLTTGNPSYRIVMHSPLHTNCTCSAVYEISERYI